MLYSFVYKIDLYLWKWIPRFIIHHDIYRIYQFTENSNISKENVKKLYLFATSNIQETWCYPDVGYENVLDNRERSTTDIPNFCGCITTNHLIDAIVNIKCSPHAVR
jgi:hypothetical protein